MSIWQVASTPFWLTGLVGVLVALKIFSEPAEQHERHEIDVDATYVLALGVFLFLFAAWMWHW